MKSVKRKSLAMMLVATLAVLLVPVCYPISAEAVDPDNITYPGDPYPELEWWDYISEGYDANTTITISSTADKVSGKGKYEAHYPEDGWFYFISLPKGYTGTVTVYVTSEHEKVDFTNTIWHYCPNYYNGRILSANFYSVVSGIENTSKSSKLTIPVTDYDGGGQTYEGWMKYDNNKKTTTCVTIMAEGANLDDGLPMPKTLPSIVGDCLYNSETDDPYLEKDPSKTDPTPTPDPVPSPAPTDSPIIEEAADGNVVVKDVVDATGKSKVSKEVVSEGTMYRMYDPNRGEHMYTKNASEMQQLVSLGWQHEASADFNVIAATEKGATPVYRVYNPNGGGMHFYTQNAEEAKGLAAGGWTYEGISHYVYSKDSGLGTPQYRLYNPNSTNGEHNWTTNEQERDNLIAAGWQNEGACWNIK